MKLPGPFRNLAKRALPAGKGVRTLPFGIGRGLKMSVDFHNGQTGMYLGLYEIELNRFLRRLCPPGTKCFDVGGQMGYDALIMAKLTGAPVVTVEPESHWCEVIRQNVRLNPHIAPLVSICEAFIDCADNRAKRRCTIDTLADETFMPKFIKVDIEGGEAAALKGADRVLSEHPGLLIEVHSLQLERECDELLRIKGYMPIVVDQRKWLPDHRPSTHNRWLVARAPGAL